jgi:hypothetical protein
VDSRGKWLLIHFSGGGTLATHMLMSGSWHIYRHGERWQQPRQHAHRAGEQRVRCGGFRVPVAKMMRAHELARALRIPPAAIDVLSAEFDAAKLRGAFGAWRRGDWRCAAAPGSDCGRGQCVQVGDLFCDCDQPVLQSRRAGCGEDCVP